MYVFLQLRNPIVEYKQVIFFLLVLVVVLHALGYNDIWK